MRNDPDPTLSTISDPHRHLIPDAAHLGLLLSFSLYSTLSLLLPGLERCTPFLLPTPRRSPKHHRPAPLVRAASKTPSFQVALAHAVHGPLQVWASSQLGRAFAAYRCNQDSFRALLCFSLILDLPLSISELCLLP